MELWDLYDSCFNKTGRVHERGKPLNEGDFHLVVHIYPVNSKGEILIQKRAETLSWKPGYWAATGGSAEVGEDAFTACRRELFEELGIEATLNNTTLEFMSRRGDHFTTVWIVRIDIDIDELVLQPSEVSEAKWVTAKQLQEMMDEGIFYNYTYLEYLFKTGMM